MHIRNEIKFLYLKKQQLNKLYLLNLINANEWSTIWNNINEDINTKLNIEIKKKYMNINQKLKTLEERQKTTPTKYKSQQFFS